VRRLIAASIATVTLAPLGLRAADLPPPVPGPAVYAPPPAYRAVANWGGFYIGGNVGVGLARDRSTFSVGGVPFATADTAVFGAVAGGQAGYNWQSGALVLGAEADFDWSNPKGSISAQCATCLTVTNASLEHDINWFGKASAMVRRGGGNPPEPPPWPEVHRRLQQEGRTSKVDHPSAAQLRFEIPPPKTTRQVTLKSPPRG
jgi:outer membrane immunogenic protein